VCRRAGGYLWYLWLFRSTSPAKSGRMNLLWNFQSSQKEDVERREACVGPEQPAEFLAKARTTLITGNTS